MNTESSWFDADDSDVVDASFKDYLITSTPNDFNIKTICDFVESGVVKIPGFQRNYVWDIERASKLVESILIGLPIPQIFLYEKARNEFLVIDGQQRLMTIFYFFKGRFPKKDKRQAIREHFSQKGTITKAVFEDDNYFSKFNLVLPGPTQDSPSRFNKANYETLDSYKFSFDMSTIRNIIIKQNAPTDDDDSAIFEIFNRLNTGGVNLSPHEIRVSLYYSDFLAAVDRITFDENWLYFTGKKVPDINLKDAEIIFRAFAMMHEGLNYREPMGAFLNKYAKRTSKLEEAQIKYASELISRFLEVYAKYPREIFSVTTRTRFNIAFFESVFRVICESAFSSRSLDIPMVPKEKFDELRQSDKFLQATRFATGQSSKVQDRYNEAKRILIG